MNNITPQYWKPLLLALLATAAISIASHYVLKDVYLLGYIDTTINGRGIAPYGVIFFGLGVTFCALLAIRKKDYRQRISYLFLIMSLMTLVCGVVDWQMSLHGVRAVYRTRMANSPTADEIAKIEEAYTFSNYVAFDPMWFAIVFFSLSFSVSFNHFAFVSAQREIVPVKSPRNTQLRYFKAWVAYFTIHASISFLTITALHVLALMYYNIFVGSQAKPPQSMNILSGLLINVLLSYPIFKWVCKNTILPQTIQEEA